MFTFIKTSGDTEHTFETIFVNGTILYIKIANFLLIAICNYISLIENFYINCIVFTLIYN